MSLSIAIISGRRPDLLEDTLASFSKRVFKHFDITRFYANIDPFCGDETEHRHCVQIIRGYFPDAVISEPAQPGFGKAVKTLWSQIETPFALHLEDDWIALEDIVPDQVFPQLTGTTTGLRLMCKELDWNGQDIYLERVVTRRFLGITYDRRRVSMFGTSPAFYSGPFLRRCAALLRPEMDPEKQMHRKLNAPLAAYLHQHRCRLLTGRGQRNIIEDIGRDWRERRGIFKVVSKGVSTWTHAGESA